MAAAAFLYNSWRSYSQRGANLRTGAIKATLHNSSYTPSVTTQTAYADLTNELATNFGYSNGGLALSSVLWTQSGATVALTASPTIWNCTGSNLVARYCVVRYVGTVDSLVDPLMLYVLMDTVPADITATPGNALTITWNVSGIVVTS